MQDRNKWCVVSIPPQPLTHNCASWGMMSRALSFVGNLFWRSLQTKIETSKRTCVCQIKSEASSRLWNFWIMSNLYIPLNRVTTGRIKLLLPLIYRMSLHIFYIMLYINEIQVMLNLFIFLLIWLFFFRVNSVLPL